MSLRTYLSALPLCLLALACGAPRIEPSRAAAWADAKTAAPELNVAGTWESTLGYMSGGWGSGEWIQNGARIAGGLGPFSVEGRIAGHQAYLVFLSRGKVYYTAILEMDKEGGLVGLAYTNALADDPTAQSAEKFPVHLVRPKTS